MLINFYKILLNEFLVPIINISDTILMDAI